MRIDTSRIRGDTSRIRGDSKRKEIKIKEMKREENKMG